MKINDRAPGHQLADDSEVYAACSLSWWHHTLCSIGSVWALWLEKNLWRLPFASQKERKGCLFKENNVTQYGTQPDN